MGEAQDIFTYDCNMVVTLSLAAVLLIFGHFIKRVIPILELFFIPAPVIGGLFFSIITLIGHKANLFAFTFDSSLKDLLMTAFFTSIGFTASFKVLVKGGIAVAIFLGISILLICIQNGVGIGLAYSFGLDPLIGLATGSISLSGGHGTSAAFGPLLEKYGLDAGLSVAVAAATFGLVAGSMIGGPIGKRLLEKYKLRALTGDISNNDMVEGKLTHEEKFIDEHNLFVSICMLIIAMGLGYWVIQGFNALNIILPGYLGPMLVAAVIRNFCDLRHKQIPIHTINMTGGLALSFFLAMALMTMRLWELQALAIPLITILIVQTIIMGLFAYFVTFRLMGKDYDAAVLACGQCGFGMGATPNAIANMRTFTWVNGESPKAFFVVPIVGSLFIDFFNALIITSFMNILV
ncbi:MAG: sodium/glutamate symporter [Succinivibrionaceae bacterium]|nr:sodium/glutamate symporter [Succinivibrionaceae bacterium]